MSESDSTALIASHREQRARRRHQARWIDSAAVIAVFAAMFIENDVAQLGLWLAAVAAMILSMSMSITPSDELARRELARNAAVGFVAQAAVITAVAAYYMLADRPMPPVTPIAAVVLTTAAVTGFSTRFDPK